MGSPSSPFLSSSLSLSLFEQPNSPQNGPFNSGLISGILFLCTQPKKALMLKTKASRNERENLLQATEQQKRDLFKRPWWYTSVHVVVLAWYTSIQISSICFHQETFCSLTYLLTCVVHVCWR